MELDKIFVFVVLCLWNIILQVHPAKIISNVQIKAFWPLEENCELWVSSEAVWVISLGVTLPKQEEEEAQQCNPAKQHEEEARRLRCNKWVARRFSPESVARL